LNIGFQPVGNFNALYFAVVAYSDKDLAAFGVCKSNNILFYSAKIFLEFSAVIFPFAENKIKGFFYPSSQLPQFFQFPGLTVPSAIELIVKKYVSLVFKLPQNNGKRRKSLACKLTFFLSTKKYYV